VANQVIWRRAGAYLLDSILLAIVITILQAAGLPEGALLAIDIVLWFGGRALLDSRTGATPGKMVLDLKVVDETGMPPSLEASFKREAMLVVDYFPYVFPLVGLIAALRSEHQQRLGDRVANTFVIRATAEEPVLAGVVGADAPAGAPAAAAAGWYPAPRGEKRLRWWDGETWTADTAD
jgi:uncharacterized RDD family membrane protein YckC